MSLCSSDSDGKMLCINSERGWFNLICPLSHVSMYHFLEHYWNCINVNTVQKVAAQKTTTEMRNEMSNINYTLYKVSWLASVYQQLFKIYASSQCETKWSALRQM